jgi:DNA polymerase III subunit alpha
LIAEGALAIDNFSGALRLTVEKLYDIEQARESFSRGIKLNWTMTENKPESINYIERLTEVLSPFKGGSCPVTINYTSKYAQAVVQLGDEWRVHPTDDLISRLKSLFGSAAVEIRYR